MHEIEGMHQQRQKAIIHFPRHNSVTKPGYTDKGFGGCTVSEQLRPVVTRYGNFTGIIRLHVTVEPEFDDVDPAHLIAVLVATALAKHDDQMCIIFMTSNAATVEGRVRNPAQWQVATSNDIESEQAIISNNDQRFLTQ